MNERGTHLYVLEHDIYARQAIVSYLSWDRRTRVVGHSASIEELAADLEELSVMRLDALLLDESLGEQPDSMLPCLAALRELLPETRVIVLAQRSDASRALLAKQAGAAAYLWREEVGMSIASAVAAAMHVDFLVTPAIQAALRDMGCLDSSGQACLPAPRSFPRLTQRIQQALWLCVIEGLPADLAAEEMGVSTSTVRSYIKEGYRILEASDATPLPLELSPAERAFLRLTALELSPAERSYSVVS